MSSPESCETINTAEENSDEYTNDFEDASVNQSSNQGLVTASDDFKTASTSSYYSNNSAYSNKFIKTSVSIATSQEQSKQKGIPSSLEIKNHSGTAQSYVDETSEFSGAMRDNICVHTERGSTRLEVEYGTPCNQSMYSPRTSKSRNQRLCPVKSDIHNIAYSDDFEIDTNTVATPRSPKPPQTTRQRGQSPAWSEASTLGYSDDFESLTTYTPRRNVDKSTNQPVGYNVTYSDDFEPNTYTPRTPRHVTYSDDFDQTTTYHPEENLRQSMNTLYSYTQSFDAESDSSDAQTVESSEETSQSDRVQVEDSMSKASTVYSQTEQESNKGSFYTSTEGASGTTEEYSLEQEDIDAVSGVARRQFINHRINMLLNPESANTKMSSPPSSKGPTPGSNTNTFLKTKLKLLQRKKQCGNVEDCKNLSSAVEHTSSPLRMTEDKSDRSISLSLINRLKAENSLAKIKTFLEEEIHEPTECPHCRVQISSIALWEFAKVKKSLVEAKMSDAFENNPYLYGDVVSLMGEGIRALPSHAASYKDIMEQLLRPLSNQLWGSKLLRVNEEQVPNKSIEQTLKQTWRCPHLARFSDDNKDISDSISQVFKGEMSTFIDCENKVVGVSDNTRDQCDSNNIEKPDTDLNLFSIFAAKNGEFRTFNDKREQDMKDSDNASSTAVQEVVDDVLERSLSDISDPKNGSHGPVPLTIGKVPDTLKVPESRQAFWKAYFAPLKNCSWFPNNVF